MFSQDLARKWRRRTMQQLATELIRKRQLQPDNNNTNHANNNDDNTRQVTYIGMITTAHHKDDSEETILLKLLRGVHISNIAGLSIVQQCPNAASSNSAAVASDANTGGVFDNLDDEYGTDMGIRNNGTLIYWVRPLLNVRKQELVRYLQQNNFTWREDISNQSSKYLRNRIRNELIPLLHVFNRRLCDVR
jgi:tRNA(Ile)-lysidine synthase TilS/MesJ